MTYKFYISHMCGWLVNIAQCKGFCCSTPISNLNFRKMQTLTTSSIIIVHILEWFPTGNEGCSCLGTQHPKECITSGTLSCRVVSCHATPWHIAAMSFIMSSHVMHVMSCIMYWHVCSFLAMQCHVIYYIIHVYNIWYDDMIWYYMICDVTWRDVTWHDRTRHDTTRHNII